MEGGGDERMEGDEQCISRSGKILESVAKKTASHFQLVTINARLPVRQNEQLTRGPGSAEAPTAPG